MNRIFGVQPPGQILCTPVEGASRAGVATNLRISTESQELLLDKAAVNPDNDPQGVSTGSEGVPLGKPVAKPDNPRQVGPYFFHLRK